MNGSLPTVSIAVVLTALTALTTVGSSACSNDSASSPSSSTVPTSSSPDLPPGDVDAASLVTDAGACFVRSSSYDRTCTQDSDCVAVPSGGNVCDPCDNDLVACLGCTYSAVNQAAAPAYLATLKAQLALYEQTGLGCITTSCPTVTTEAGSAVACVAGVCTGPYDAPGFCD